MEDREEGNGRFFSSLIIIIIKRMKWKMGKKETEDFFPKLKKLQYL